MNDLVVCKFAGCGQVYIDPRILPCGKRTCAVHIEAMMVTSDNCIIDIEVIKCHFCEEIHTLPDSGKDFPVDENIHILLNMKHCSEHDAAKQSFNELTQMLDKLIKLDREDIAIDYFERVEADILLEKEVNMQKLAAYYQKLVGDVHQRKVQCLHSLKINRSLGCELEAFRHTLLEHESKLKRDNLDFVLKTLDGDDNMWKRIQSECRALRNTIKPLDEELNDKIIGDQKLQFKASTISTQMEDICGLLSFEMIDSRIINNYTKEKDLVELCKLSGKQFKLLYRASRDGFKASSFHAKCDNKPSTLTIIKTTKGYVFGGYTAVAWHNVESYQSDSTAFIFSLVNMHSKPCLIPVKDHEEYSIYSDADYGPTFGSGYDLHVANDSNKTTDSYTDLGFSYNFKLFINGTREAKSFLAGSLYFQTSEIEVFQLN